MKPPPLPKSIRYLDHLGRGGTADVVRVRVQGNRHDSALKYPINNDAESIAAFILLAERERSLIGDISFPGFVQLKDNSELDVHHLLLELCDGPTLDSVGTIDNVNKVLNIISAIALTMNFLKIHRIIHGDIKPQNIFLPKSWNEIRDDQLFYLKLSDFSLGRRLDESDDARVGLGTVGFMAPETLTDNICNHRSDIFAAGVIAYQLILGRHPFIDPDDPDPVRTNSRVRETELLSPSEGCRDMNPKVSELVLAMLEKDPRNRPASGWDICTRLAECGATYPYKKAIHPKHLFITGCNYDEAVAQSLKLSPSEQERLDLVTDRNPQKLRMTLPVNFHKGNLTLQGDRFEFVEYIYWPDRLRRETLNKYRMATFAERRRIVRTAIAGGQSAVCNQVEPGIDSCLTADGLSALILPLLNSSTVKTVSSQIAPSAERLEMYEAATRLYIQAGNLERAERCAYQAAIALNKNHQNDTALSLLQQVIDYARMVGSLFEVRQLLMSRGDILKEIGDAAPAMDTYNEIISLYKEQPADKLLAETYKDMGDLYKIKQDPTAGLSALDKAMRIYSDLGEELEISNTLNNIGNLQWVGANYPAALKSYRRALKIQRRHKAMYNVASTLSNIGSVYFVRGHLVRAIRLYRLSINICREIANELEEARILNNLGYVYHVQGMADEALSCLDRSLEINRKIGTKKEILFNLENMISIMIGAGRLKQSVHYLKEGMALALELDDQAHLGAFTGGMGRTLKRMGRYSEAEAFYRDAASLYDEGEDPIGQARLEISRADLRYRVGDSQGAVKIAVETLGQRTAVDDKPQELEALLVLTRISDRCEYLDRARELVVELKLKRERVLVEFNALGRSLRQGVSVKDLEQYTVTLDVIDQMHNDIELPWMNNLAGELMIVCERYADAAVYLERALKLAEDFGLLAEQIDSHTLIGRVYLHGGSYEKAYACFRRALEIARKISEQISAPDDRSLFQNRQTIKFLMIEIKKLAKSLSTKKQAGA